MSHPTTYRTPAAGHVSAPRFAASGVRPLSTPKPRVVTWLFPRDRARAEAASADQLILLHADALPAVRDALAAGRAEAVLLSAAHARASDVLLIAQLLHDFPTMPVAGIIIDGDDERCVVTGTLLLGVAGVRKVLDCRSATGWTALRNTFHPSRMPDDFLRSCVFRVLDAIGRDVERSEDSDTADPEMGDPAAGDPANHAAVRADGLVRFFTLVFRPGVSSVKVLGTHLGVQSSTLASRFYRAGLPSPKRYLTWARLAWAAGLGESPGLSIRAIADRLDASSPQSFHRTVRQCTGYTAAEFCRMATGARMLDHYLTTLVAPYRDVLRDFDPLGSASTTTRRLPKGVQAAAGRVA